MAADLLQFRGTAPMIRQRPETADMQDAELKALMKRAQGGDKAAYRALLGACEARLKLHFARRAGNHAEDLVQEVLLAIHAKRHTYDPAYPFGAWLMAIARYKWIDWLRRECRTELATIEDDFADDNIVDPTSEHATAQMLNQLPDAQAKVIHLTKIEGYSVREASEMTGQSEPLVKVNVFRGLKKLRDFLTTGEKS